MTVSFPRGIESVMGSSNGGSLGSGVQNMLNNLASFVRNFPTECHRHVIVITFILRNKHHTNIQIEIQELEGGVKATGLFCLLGIGIGLGSLFIYKLYTRLFPKILLPPPQTPAKIKRPNSSDLGCQNLPTTNNSACAGDKVLAETPDSGISTSTVGRDNRPLPASNPQTYLLDIRQLDTDPILPHRRRNTVAEWLAHADLVRSSDFASEADFASDIYGNRRDAFKSLRSWRSSGYVSIDQMTGAVSCEGDVHGSSQRKRILNEQGPTCFRLDEDSLSDGVLSITDHILVPSLVSENPEDELANVAIDGLILGSNEDPFHATGKASSLPCHHHKFSSGSNLSPDVNHRWLRRNHHSFGSDLSAASSGCTYRESLVSKGFSVDLGEDLTGILTPPDGDNGALDHWTMSSMDQLHKELRRIQEDIDYMNEKVEVLLSKEDAAKVTRNVSSADEEEDGEENKRIAIEARRQRRRGRSRSLSSVRSRSLSIDPEIEDELDTPDFIWDYHSDLALDKYDESMFIVKRPCPVFSEGTVDLAAAETTLNPEANITGSSEKHRTSKRCASAGLNQIRLDSFGEAYFEDEVCLGSSGFDSPSRHHEAVRMNSAGTREHVHSSSALRDADPPKCSHQSHHICDHQSCLTDSCFPDGFCGHFQPPCFSDLCSCCRGKLFFMSHPHHSCASCHGLRRGRPSSARTSRKYDRPSSSGRCKVCSSQCQNCAICWPHPAVHQCGNSTIIRNKSPDVGEGRGQCVQLSNVTDSQESTLQPDLKPVLSKVNSNSKTINIGNKVNIRDHLAQELGRHGNERKSDMRKGFDLLNRLWGISSIRKIQNDNYSNLRAVLYQALIHDLPILADTGNFQNLVQKLAMAIDSGHSYLTGWKFGYPSVLPEEETVMKMTECLRILFEQVEAVAGMSSAMCREQYLLALLNHSSGMDHSLLEGLKILMILKAIDLCSEHAGHRNTPSFMLPLFAKESSKPVESFFTNHINVIGNTRPMRAVEMSLLGLTLGVRIEVIQPSLFNKEGFVLHYPDEGADGFDKVLIIQEERDWIHYSVPVMKYTD